MNEYVEQDYKMFNLLHQWGLVTAGSIEHFNSCTVGFGSFGTLWAGFGDSDSVVTVYLHPSRYTCDFMKENDTFTLSFFPAKYKRALGYMGTHSGRDGDKAAAAGLTPVSMGEGVSYEEANLVFLCRKVYQQQFLKESMSPEILEYHQSMPQNGPDGDDWQPHWFFIGRILDVKDTRTAEDDEPGENPFDMREMFSGFEPPRGKEDQP